MMIFPLYSFCVWLECFHRKVFSIPFPSLKKIHFLISISLVSWSVTVWITKQNEHYLLFRSKRNPVFDYWMMFRLSCLLLTCPLLPGSVSLLSGTTGSFGLILLFLLTALNNHVSTKLWLFLSENI